MNLIIANTAAIHSLDLRVTALESSVANIILDLAAINDDIAAINSDVLSIQENILTIEYQLSLIAEQIVVISQDLAALQEDNFYITLRVDNLETEVDTIKDELIVIGNRITALELGYTNLSNDITTINHSLTIIDSHLSALDGQVTMLENTTDDLQNDINSLEAYNSLYQFNVVSGFISMDSGVVTLSVGRGGASSYFNTAFGGQYVDTSYNSGSDANLAVCLTPAVYPYIDASKADVIITGGGYYNTSRGSSSVCILVMKYEASNLFSGGVYLGVVVRFWLSKNGDYEALTNGGFLSFCISFNPPSPV